MKDPGTYLNEQLDIFGQLLPMPQYKCTPEHFHKLRVAIKKIHSLFELMNGCLKHFHRKKQFDLFKDIFQHAGKVREVQLQQEKLQRYFRGGKLTGYSTLLKAEEKIMKHDYFATREKVTTSNAIQPKELIRTIRTIDEAAIKKFIERESKQLHQLSKGSLKNDQLHEIRKKLKMLQYIEKATGQKAKDNGLFSRHRSLSTQLGDWHDIHVLTRHIDNALKHSMLSDTEKEQLKKIKVILSKRSDRQTKNLKTKIHAYSS